MSEANTRVYPSITDGRLLAILSELLENEICSSIDLKFPGDTGRSLQSPSDAKELETELALTNTKLISNAVIIQNSEDSRSNMFVDFRRAKTTWTSEGNKAVKKLVPSQYEFEIEVRRPGVFHEDALEVMRAFDDALLGGGSIPAAAIPNEMLSALASHTEAFAAASAKTFDDARLVRKEAEQEIAKLREQQEQEFADRKKLADEDLAALRKQVADREAELERRLKEVDDRTNMHARRAKAKQIADRLSERLQEPSVGADVGNTRRQIVYLSSIALVVSSVIIGSGVFVFLPGFLATDLNSMIFASARIVGGSAAFFFVLIYLLSFLKRIASEDAATKQQLERYSLDMDRSSWAIETVLETQARGDQTAVPDVWMKGVTSNLFQVPVAEDEDKSALDALGELLKTGAAVKIGPDGASLDLQGRAAKKTGKSGD